MADPVVAELNERFASGDRELEPDVVAELRSIMRLYDLSPEDLFFKFESYSMKMELEGVNPSIQVLRAFKQDIQSSLERSHRAQAHVKSEKRAGATPRSTAKGADVFSVLEGLVPTTPGTGKLGKMSSARKRQLETPSISRVKSEHPGSSPDNKSPSRLDDANGAVSSFHDRPNPGEVIEVLNEEIPVPDPPVAPFTEPRIRIATASDQKPLGYKTMAMKISEVANVLDERIEEFTALVKEHRHLDDAQFGNAAAQSTAEIVAVGRIASDSPEGKLNAASLVLEMSRQAGNGHRVPLNLEPLKGRYQFFPGQIVALKGSNTSGREFVVAEVLSPPPLPVAASQPSELEVHRARLRGAGPDAMDTDDSGPPPPLNVLFASGPYTADDNLDFEPLHALCARAVDELADALVLAGPFIDVGHPLIASGDFDLPDGAFDPDTATLSAVFKHLVSPALHHLAAANPSVTIILVPSVRDAVARHVSWPQEAFPRKDLGLPRAARVVGNPATLRLNELALGISTQDVLFELRQEELLGARPPDPVLLSRLPRYLLEQRHYFPLFPPTDRRRLPKVGGGGPDGEVPPGAVLDAGYLKLGEMIKTVAPDVLVAPSSLPPFVKVIDSVLVVNPGHLSKRRGAGTYARMIVQAPPTSDAEMSSGGLIAHRVYSRARVDIIRI